MKSFSEQQFEKMAKKGHVTKATIDQHEMILAIMLQGWKEKQKVWWFAYELMGHKKIEGESFFMSYKAGTRVSELSQDGKVESRKSDGKLHLYASNVVLDLAQ